MRAVGRISSLCLREPVRFNAWLCVWPTSVGVMNKVQCQYCAGRFSKANIAKHEQTHGAQTKKRGKPKGCSKPTYLIVIGAGKSAIRKRPAIQKQKAVISKSRGENNKDGEPLTRPSEYHAPTSKP